MDSRIRSELILKLDSKLVDELLTTYKESKQNFFSGGLRLQSVEGGRFCEAAFRLIEYITTGAYTPLGRSLEIDKLLVTLGNLQKNKFLDSIRLHIPRALRVVYDIRSCRNAAHLADGIDPNLQDATLVCAILDWVLAEFVRLYHGVNPDEAQKIVNELVTRKIPLIQNFDGHPKVLNPKLSSGDFCMVLLYDRGMLGATYKELVDWSLPKMKKNLKRTLTILDKEKAYLFEKAGCYKITIPGLKYVEEKILREI
ncbi:MAG: hypothetical protein JNM93_05335 [Bacteriovoracaceae bacterium]|nr:hypothetical protein [Bacteriovoracaceae bacterium]